MKQHIVNKCRTAMLNIQRIKHLRPLLTEDITQVLVLGLVISHIDSCNSLFVALPERHFQITENTKCWCQTGTQKTKIIQCNRNIEATSLAAHMAKD